MPKCHSCAWHEHLRDHCELEPGYPNGCDAFRSTQATFLQGLACVVIILGIYVLLLWMENAPSEDLMFVLLAVPGALVAGLVAHRLNEGGPR